MSLEAGESSKLDDVAFAITSSMSRSKSCAGEVAAEVDGNGEPVYDAECNLPS